MEDSEQEFLTSRDKDDNKDKNKSESYDDFNTTDEEPPTSTRANKKKKRKRKSRKNNRNNTTADFHASDIIKHADKNARIEAVRQQATCSTKEADTLARYSSGYTYESDTDSNFSSDVDSAPLNPKPHADDLFETKDERNEFTRRQTDNGTRSLEKLFKTAKRDRRKRSRKSLRRTPQGNFWTQYRDPPPAKKRKIDLRNTVSFFQEYIGLAPAHEISSTSAARARFHIETRKSESDHWGVSLLDNQTDSVANHVMFDKHHPNMTMAEIARAQACEALAPTAPYSEPIFHQNQKSLKPLVRECKVTKKRIRAAEDLVTILHREAWGKVPETRDEHRQLAKKANFSTTAERKFLKMYQENARHPEKNLFKMDNCNAARSILQHAWGLNFRIAEMGRAQKMATTEALQALIRLTPAGEGVNVADLRALLAVDSKSTGVQWFLKEKLSALVHNTYSPSDVPWNFNTESRITYLVKELRQHYDFLTPLERGVRQPMTTLTSRSEAPDPMQTRAARQLMTVAKQRNSAQKVTESTNATGMDKLSKEAAKQIQNTSKLFLRL